MRKVYSLVSLLSLAVVAGQGCDAENKDKGQGNFRVYDTKSPASKQDTQVPSEEGGKLNPASLVEEGPGYSLTASDFGDFKGMMLQGGRGVYASVRVNPSEVLLVQAIPKDEGGDVDVGFFDKNWSQIEASTNPSGYAEFLQGENFGSGSTEVRVVWYCQTGFCNFNAVVSLGDASRFERTGKGVNQRRALGQRSSPRAPRDPRRASQRPGLGETEREGPRVSAGFSSALTAARRSTRDRGSSR